MTSHSEPLDICATPEEHERQLTADALSGYLIRADEWEAQGAKYAAATVRDLVREIRVLGELVRSAPKPPPPDATETTTHKCAWCEDVHMPPSTKPTTTARKWKQVFVR